jgi:polysaccharide pyruvyl transferase WcaK-like protein
MKARKILLLGSYGQSNLGDDLLMWNYLKLLEDRGAKEIYVNANTTKFIPDVIKKSFPNLHIVLTYKTSLTQYIQLIQSVDCIVYGGGTLYKELYSSTGRSPYSVIIRLMGFNILAKILGTRVYHLNIGIGSLKTRLGRFITKQALNASTKTVFRDKESYDIARDSLAVRPKKIQQSVDGLFMDSVWRSVWHKKDLKIDRKKYKHVVGINVLSDIPDWVDREAYIATMKKFVGHALRSGDYVVFIPFQTDFNPRNDLKFMQEIFSDTLKNHTNYTILEQVPIDLVYSYMTQCDVLVGMRFHSLLLASACNLPFVAIAYDTKCWRFIEEIGYSYAVKLENLQYEALVSLYDSAIDNRKVIREQLKAATEKMYNEAEESLRTLNL